MQVAKETHGYGFAVVHMDADAPDTTRAYAERFLPGYVAIQESEAEVNQDIVPVIPVRMTEAWMLVDFDAFRETIGTSKTGEELGFPPHPRQVESIQAPKDVFETAVRHARPNRRRQTPAPEDVYTSLAARVDLGRLERVPAYAEFKNNVETLLVRLSYIEAD